MAHSGVKHVTLCEKLIFSACYVLLQGVEMAPFIFIWDCTDDRTIVTWIYVSLSVICTYYEQVHAENMRFLHKLTLVRR